MNNGALETSTSQSDKTSTEPAVARNNRMGVPTRVYGPGECPTKAKTEPFKQDDNGLYLITLLNGTLDVKGNPIVFSRR